VDQKVKACQEKCREDLQSTTSFVTWSLHSGNKAGVESVLGPARAAAPSERDDDEPRARRERDEHHGFPDEREYDRRDDRDRHRSRHRDDERDRRRERERDRRERDRRDDGATRRDRRDENAPVDAFDVSGALAPRAPVGGGGVGSKDVISLMDNTLWNRQMKDVTLDVVDLLVRQIYAGIRGYVVQSVELKFNCFFLMPLVDTFPARLREELECAYDEDLDEVFDVGAVRVALESRLKNLESELQCVERLQQKFAMIHSTLSVVVSGDGGGAKGGGGKGGGVKGGGGKGGGVARSKDGGDRIAAAIGGL
jgi:hypothetical protein